MIRSMTGFGRAAFEVEGVHFDVEIRSVNHRYLDLRVRLPRVLAVHEAEVRAVLQERFARGKVDFAVQIPTATNVLQRLEVDLEAAGEYLRVAEQLERERQLAGGLDVASLLGLPGVSRFSDVELPAEPLHESLLQATREAAEALDGMRAREGEALQRELEKRLGHVTELTHALEERAGAVQQLVREKLRKRAEQLREEVGLLDEARLHQEIVIAADRLDVTEELVRLRSHVDQFRGVLSGAGPGAPVGRRLDFLLQELGREANTVGSKGGDAPVAHLVVDLKTELERIREQIQNVE